MADTEAPVVLADRDARGVVTLTLNRPRSMNALSEAVLATLKAELAAIAGDPSVRVVVVAGAGKAFSAGHDLKEMRAAPSLDYYRGLFAACSEVMRLRSCDMTDAVKATIGIDAVSALARIRPKASMPLMSGSWMSISTRSGLCASAWRTPSMPFTASSVV